MARWEIPILTEWAERLEWRKISVWVLDSQARKVLQAASFRAPNGGAIAALSPDGRWLAYARENKVYLERITWK